MTALEALKRLEQETAPNTYLDDFDKRACIDAIKKELMKDRLPKIKGYCKDCRWFKPSFFTRMNESKPKLSGFFCSNKAKYKDKATANSYCSDFKKKERKER